MPAHMHLCARLAKSISNGTTDSPATSGDDRALIVKTKVQLTGALRFDEHRTRILNERLVKAETLRWKESAVVEIAKEIVVLPVDFSSHLFDAQRPQIHQQLG